MEKICVIGLGYIGLPTASILANNGYDVLGIDINDKVIDKLKNGSPHIEEPDLKGIFISAINSGKLRVSKKVEKSDVFIISRLFKKYMVYNTKFVLLVVKDLFKRVLSYKIKKN